jgi:hypothetical protein
MIGRVRRWRLLALLLLAITPGFAGTVLDGLHPCPENAPWTAAAATGHGDHGNGGDHGTPAHSGECHCLGACIGAVAALPFAPVLPVATYDIEFARTARAAPADLPASQPSDRLPPSTAPPLG